MKGGGFDIRVALFAGFLVSALVCAPAPVFADWPGSGSTSAGDARGWPGSGSTSAGDARGWPGGSGRSGGAGEKGSRKSMPAGANNFICTFSSARHSDVLRDLPMGPAGLRRCPRGGTRYGSYFTGERQKALQRLIASAGVRNDRIIAVEQRGIKNAYATLCADDAGRVKQLIAWDPDFLSELDERAGTKWASIAVLAHELAHHLNNDTGQNPGVIPPAERREQELYADRYAGQKLGEFGISKRDSVAVFHHMGAGGATHPPSGQRVAAARQGWERARRPEVGDPPPDDTGRNVPPENPQPDDTGRREPRADPTPRLAMICQTNIGFCYASPMARRVPVGARCVCGTPMGPIPGIAR